MHLSDINAKLESLEIVLGDSAKPFVKNIQNVSDPVDIEGLYKVSIVTYSDKNNLLWEMPLKTVVVPIVLNNAGINYFLFVGQSRFVFGGKVSLEVNRGFVTDNNIDSSLYWESLVTRKVPYLLDYANIFKVVDMGWFYQHPDITNMKIPIQCVFAKTKYEMDIAELKKNLKAKHDYLNEPKYGPPLHNTEPVLKSFDEVNLRLHEIMFNTEKTKDEFYLNDLFSMTAIFKVFEYIKLNELPYGE
jgi:hypothetical protein